MSTKSACVLGVDASESESRQATKRTAMSWCVMSHTGRYFPGQEFGATCSFITFCRSRPARLSWPRCVVRASSDGIAALARQLSDRMQTWPCHGAVGRCKQAQGGKNQARRIGAVLGRERCRFVALNAKKLQILRDWVPLHILSCNAHCRPSAKEDSHEQLPFGLYHTVCTCRRERCAPMNSGTGRTAGDGPRSDGTPPEGASQNSPPPEPKEVELPELHASLVRELLQAGRAGDSSSAGPMMIALSGHVIIIASAQFQQAGLQSGEVADGLPAYLSSFSTHPLEHQLRFVAALTRLAQPAFWGPGGGGAFLPPRRQTAAARARALRCVPLQGTEQTSFSRANSCATSTATA